VASDPKYYFTEFKSLKTEMIAEATKEAKKSANEFAKNSGSAVGKIKEQTKEFSRYYQAIKLKKTKSFLQIN